MMNSDSFVQIILILFASLSAGIAIFIKFSNPLIVKVLNVIASIFILLSLVFSIMLVFIQQGKENKQSEKKETEHKQYLDSLSRIIIKSDSTLQIQATLQKRTDSLLIKSNQISEETQNVLSNTASVLKNQEKSFADEERKRNPLFPMDLKITLKLSPVDDFFKRVVDSVYHYKNSIENSVPHDKNNISVSWSGNGKKVSTLILRDFEKFIRRNDENENQGFYKNHSVLNFSIMLFVNFNGDFDQLFKSTPIFNAITSKQLGAIHGVSDLEFDFESNTIYLIARFAKLAFLHPTPKGPIGVTDLINHYLIFFGRDGFLCYSEIIGIDMEIGRPVHRAWIHLTMDRSDLHAWGSDKNCKIFVKKVNRNGMIQYVQPSD